LIVGTVTIDLSLPGVNSLKEKRRRLKSLLARIRNKFNVSIAEIDYNDQLRAAQLGAAVVSNDSAFVDRMISKIVGIIDSEPEMILIDYRVEIL
jgi:uncharacterized protein YlxP (DUF503 family)